MKSGGNIKKRKMKNLDRGYDPWQGRAQGKNGRAHKSDGSEAEPRISGKMAAYSRAKILKQKAPDLGQERSNKKKTPSADEKDARANG